MFLTALMFLVALCLSSVAAFYSIVGLTAIFAAAVMPIIIMGSILEVAKLTVTVWLHEYWRQCKWVMKLYLVPAVGVLMLITSMGIFGFLSKAHLDQTTPVGDVQTKVDIIDVKINNEREIMKNNQALLKQLDDVVNGIMAKGGTNEFKLKDGGTYTRSPAELALQVRRQQARDRARITKDIDESNKKILALQEERAPIASEIRKMEAEVGPIKYIAALIYDDKPNKDLLEKAVRWVIIILVAVFDPLAVMMLLAATESLVWERNRRKERKQDWTDIPPLTEDFTVSDHNHDQHTDEILEPCPKCAKPMPVAPGIGPFCANPDCDVVDNWNIVKPQPNKSVVDYKVLDDNPVDVAESGDDLDDEQDLKIKEAMKLWKKLNPNQTLKEQRAKLRAGTIDHLPWLDLLDMVPPRFSFQPTEPKHRDKGDMWMRTNKIPHNLFKFSGQYWIMVDKDQNSSYTNENAYLEFLMQEVAQGRYDVSMLTEVETQAIADLAKQPKA